MQGQSAYTWFKEQRFRPIFAQSLRISKAVSQYPYYHVDLNAGSGYNHDVQVAGSPLNFLCEVERQQRPNVFVFFVDRDPRCIRELITQPVVEAFPSHRLFIHQADNADVLPHISRFIADHERRPQHAVGTIVIDPNGYDNGVPWDSLHRFCRAHPKIDLVMNLNTRWYRQARGLQAKGYAGWVQKRIIPLSEFKAWFNRPSWMWTEECRLGRTSWIQCVGRTMQTATAGYPSLGFYDSESIRGRFILQRLEDAASTDSQPSLLSHL